jgi:hypothetical protein
MLPAGCEEAASNRLMVLATQGVGPMVGCHWFTAGLPLASGLDAYRASSAWAALRCGPERFSTAPTPEFAELAPTSEAVRRLRSELGVGLVVFDRTVLCFDAPDRAKATLAVLQSSAREVSSDDRYVVFELPNG